MSDSINWVKSFIDLLESQFSEESEIVLYEVQGNIPHVCEYRNNHASGVSFLSEQSMNQMIANALNSTEKQKVFNTISTNAANHVIKSSLKFFYDENGQPVYCIGINLDITDAVNFNRRLSSFIKAVNISESDTETRINDVSGFLDHLIQEANEFIGKDASTLNKDERIVFLEYLDRHGAFQISKSSIIISELLGISKFTLYSDLDRIHSKNDC